MRSTLFRLKVTSPPTTVVHNNEQFVTTIPIPTLSAYAVEFTTLLMGGKTLELSTNCINGDQIVVHSTFDITEYECKLVINYHGIRDYELLFPNVANGQLKSRLAQFYQEAEFAFNNASWLTFMLMCGAIFEGLLFSKLNKNDSFNNLINAAQSGGIISIVDSNIMHSVRQYRNLVHANRHTEPYVSRADAMDTRRLLDAIVKAA